MPLEPPPPAPPGQPRRNRHGRITDAAHATTEHLRKRAHERAHERARADPDTQASEHTPDDQWPEEPPF